ncbi:MAG: A24 family peptidase [Verrucomicrobiota bacterium]
MEDILTHVLMPLLVGASIGSFLNVCIYRMPAEKSISSYSSRCFACGKPIPWFLNIPIVSWFVLMGRCRCKLVKLDFRYPMIEVFTALMTLNIWMAFKHEPVLALINYVICCGLIIATFVDIDHYIIPDEITIGGTILGLIVSLAYPRLHGVESIWSSFLASFGGAAFGGGGLLAVAILGMLVFRKEAMGLGDVKLMAAFGAFFGWQGPLFILAVASMIGSLMGVVALLVRGKMLGVRMPFGPSLCIAALLWIFGGNDWMNDYISVISEQVQWLWQTYQIEF